MIKLDKLRTLENGWLDDGIGIAPRESTIKLAERLVNLLFKDENDLSDKKAAIGPTEDGDIEIGWVEDGKFCHIEIFNSKDVEE